MPPIIINNQPFIPTSQQKKEMHFYLKMLLHANGSFPNLPNLQRFWDLSASQKEKTLKDEMMDSKFNSNSIFGQLDFFYSKLITSIKEKNPSIFKKGNLLNPWYSMIGKTFEEFRSSELRRWRQYNSHVQSYERYTMLNEITFDEKKVRKLGSNTDAHFSSNLQQLCLNYFSEYFCFDIQNIDQLIQSVQVNDDPLINILAKMNPIGSIRQSTYLQSNPKLLASLDPYADQYIHGNSLEKIQMLTSRKVKWIVMQVRQQEVLDYYFGSIQPYEMGNNNYQFKKISMENHEWIMEELKILIQDPEARKYLEDHRKVCFKDLKRYGILKQLYEPESIANLSLTSIFKSQQYEANQALTVLPKGNQKVNLNVKNLCSSDPSDSSEISSTLSGIDDEFWNSKIPKCCVCYQSKNDLPDNIQMYACKQAKGHFTCEPCFKTWRETNNETNLRIRMENPFARIKPLTCPECKVEINHSNGDLIHFGQLRQIDDQRELNEILQKKINEKEQLREMKTSKRIKKQFLKQLNKQIHQINPGDEEFFFKEWNEEASIAWIKKIESFQHQLDRMKQIKFIHQNEEKDFNQYNHLKYTQIIRDENDRNKQNQPRLQQRNFSHIGYCGQDSDSSNDQDEQYEQNNQPFFKKKPKAKIILRQQSINEFLQEYPDIESRNLLVAQIGYMNNDDQKKINKKQRRRQLLTIVPGQNNSEEEEQDPEIQRQNQNPKRRRKVLNRQYDS